MTRPALLESARSVTDAVSGVLHGSGQSPITSVTIDSRESGEGSLFVALPGERTDGHAFVPQALRAGAGLALVRRSYADEHAAEIDALVAETGGSVCAVDDPLAALQALSKMRLATFSGLTRIAITGSNGKTTTKEIVASVLARRAPTFKTRGNFNSEIGVPLSVFEVQDDHRFGVFECAMNHVGEMEVLADIVRPELALITNIGTAHIGLVGSQEGIAREKRQIFSQFDGTQTAILPEVDPFRPMLEEGLAGSVELYGPQSVPDYEGAESRGIDGSILKWRGRRIHLPIPGEHNLRNALAAIAVGLHFGCTDEEIHAGIEGVRPEFGRGEVYRGPVTVVQDSYNANADSMREAIHMLDATPRRGGRHVLVLGAMYELGRYAAEHHAAIAREAASSAADLVFLFGAEFEAAAAEVTEAGNGDGGARNSGTPDPTGRIRWTDSFEELSRLVSQTVVEGDLVLLKGSRGTRLERLLPLLTRKRG
jgi:UDP-N-acetylmuramoyl-tripeptide--D-alanyl-D-alanine ligase